MSILHTPRLLLEPITLPMVEAVMLGRREEAERVANARLPAAWPGRALIERAFTASLDEIRADPGKRLWGDRLMIARADTERRVIGSVVFHGCPADGVAEVAYGVEEGSQRQGLATEATRACVLWALAQPGVWRVTATTLAWHVASLRVIEKVGMRLVGTRDHELLGELLVFGLDRAAEAESAGRERAEAERAEPRDGGGQSRSGSDASELSDPSDSSDSSDSTGGDPTETRGGAMFYR